MYKKSFILSSAGLQNLNQNQNYGDEFKFYFGQREIRMNNLFAEFISPYISQIHQSDPTINSIQFYEEKYSHLFGNISEDIFLIFEQISKGKSIEINKAQCVQLQVISILIKNEELFMKLNELFQSDTSEDGLIESLDSLIFLSQNQKQQFNDCNSIRCVAKNLYLVDEQKILKLPKAVFYSIITNDELTIKNEDSFFDLINEFLDKKEEEEENDQTEGQLRKIDFYEQIEFQFLSENKFREFVDNLDINEITTDLWRQLKKCFFYDKSFVDEKSSVHRYSHKRTIFQYNGKIENAFNGIIQRLTKDCGGNVDSKNIVNVTSSSFFDNSQVAKNAVDLDDMTHYFSSDEEDNAWLKYDFIERKVKPTHYSIRTRHDYGKGRQHPKNWVIEGSDDEIEWKILDSRKNEKRLDDKNAICTFEIKNNDNEINGYRYLRMRQTGANTAGKNFLILSALEFFGTLIEQF